MDLLIFIGVTIGIVAFMVIGTLFLISRFYKKVDQGRALIINKVKGDPTVTFTGGVVIPVFNRAEVMDISVKTIELSRSGNSGLICADNIRADIQVTFFVRVNPTQEDVLKVAQSIGCARASDQKTLEELFTAKFSEALKTVGKRLQFEELYTQRDDFKDQIIDVIGRHLNGYVLEDAAIDYLEQTPMGLLDKNNILDAQGIRKITEITSKQNMATNDLRQTERKELKRQDLSADEAILELDKQRADAEARQQREIATIQARETAEANKVEAEEDRRAKLARIKADEEIELSLVNRARQIEVAQKDKERVVAIKTEQVSKERDLEVLAREREVELVRIEKEKALEGQRKEIAEVTRAKIAVEKHVAEEEERIATLRVTEQAQREKIAKVTGAEAEAEESLIKTIKSAEAQEKVAEFHARERLVLANAALEAAEKEAQAKIRMADGVKAEAAAHGLAEAQVKEADAVATEKQGMAEARVTRERMAAEAGGAEAKGMAGVKVREATAAAIQKEGLATAEVTRQQGEAEAQGVKARLLAEAAGKEADAAAVERRGIADARAVQERMQAEATGLMAKLEALKQMEGAAKEHEEFRLQLEVGKEVDLAAIDAKRAAVEAQARILGEAFGNADIKIVGGEDAFMQRMTGAVGFGEALDSFMGSSKTAQTVVGGLGRLIEAGVTKAAAPDDDGATPDGE